MSTPNKGYTFDLQSAQRIVAAVKQVETTKKSLIGSQGSPANIGTSFWAMLTGCDVTGKLWDWVAVMPNPSGMATPTAPNIFATTSLWQFRDPWTAGWGCAREANDNLGIPNGTVTLLTLIGYGQANIVNDVQLSGVSTIKGKPLLEVADGRIPFFTFTYAVQQAPYVVPPHDHRSNGYGNGGFAFSVYAPGTSLPQNDYAM